MGRVRGNVGAQLGLFQEFLFLLQKLHGETPQQLKQVFFSKTLLSFLHFVSKLRELVSSSSWLGKTRLPSLWIPRRRRSCSRQSRRRRRTDSCQPASGKSPDTEHQSALISIYQHLSASISTNQHQSESISINQNQSASINICNLLGNTYIGINAPNF